MEKKAAASLSAEENTFPVMDQVDSAPKIDALLIQRDRFPQQIKIGCSHAELAAVVGDSLEVIYPFPDPVAVVLNGKGKLHNLKPNRALRDGNGVMYDVVCGDFLVVGLDAADFISLSPELMAKFEKHFHAPEMFIFSGPRITAVPLSDNIGFPFGPTYKGYATSNN